MSAEPPAVAAALAGAAAEDEFVPAQPSRTLDLVIAFVALAATATMVLLTLGISSRIDAGGFTPREWPLILSSLGVAMSLWLVIEAIAGNPWQRDELEAATATGWRNLILTGVVAIAYVVGWGLIGFIIPTALFLLALLLVYGVRSPVALIGFSVGVTAGIYLVFHQVLRVPL